ncbi:TetR/AcrR family transcriptional regulator [Holzapfeliella floricola]|uniref:Transcriptional regulator TetR C-terminal Firmicutes type domain-containing protein n=1 Tax=Holzapfeliella floricola DSM 23037 = JCM 16512 TaxID=1423744 RepID=A0A0R2DMA6_9LACO|nr:TetR/AcrR family transcriptional regulator [Holzapfeliella floricola]KRN04806.1 hypothetical protein FC86_GL001163 [Holzapfeliella floricola DSM 23037 = JCM 16512]
MKNQKAREKIQQALYDLIESGNQLSDIKVTTLCQKAGINRSTFYDNYLDIYDLADRLKVYLVDSYLTFLKNDQEKSILSLLRHMSQYPETYRLFFWFNLDDQLTKNHEKIKQFAYQNSRLKNPYQHLFFISGLNAVIKQWLANGCQKSPEEIADLLEHNLAKLSE